GIRRHTRFSRDWSSDVCSSDLRGVDRKDLEEKLLEVGWSREMISRAFEKAGIEESSYEMEIVPYRPEPESETEPDLSSQARVELDRKSACRERGRSLSARGCVR